MENRIYSRVKNVQCLSFNGTEFEIRNTRGFSSKRVFVNMLLLTVMLLLSSCGTKRVYLQQDDFAVYKNEEFVASYLEVSGLSNDLRFNWIGSLYHTSAEELSTSRGIQFGSSLEDIASVYKGVYFHCINSDLGTMPIDDLVQKLDTNESFVIETASYFKTRDYMQGKGVPITSEKKMAQIRNGGEDILTARLKFKIESGTVSDISLSFYPG